jgi:capsular polysaccharide biosynthesis protein
MELNDALRRIIGQHWRLLTACLIGGMALGLFFAPHAKEYSASVRLVLDTPDPVARQQSQAIADTAKAIATSSSEVSRALHKARVERGDPVEFAKTHVLVSALGSSGILQLSVTDRNSRAAASIANALASGLIQTRSEVTNGQADSVFASLERRSAGLSRKIAAATDNVNSLNLQIASAGTLRNANALRDQRDAAQQNLDSLSQEKSVLESERVSLLSTSAQRPRPQIISPATAPAKPESTGRMAYLILGALVGLALGLGLAGMIETLRPTLVGSETLATELNAALLGKLQDDPSATTSANIGARLRLAAEAAGVGNVALLATGADVDLDTVTTSLRASASGRAPHQNGTPAASSGLHEPAKLRIAPFEPMDPPFNNGRRSGLVLVSPTALKKTELADVSHLLKASNLPLLGLITYTPGARGIIDRLSKTVPE